MTTPRTVTKAELAELLRADKRRTTHEAEEAAPIDELSEIDPERCSGCGEAMLVKDGGTTVTRASSAIKRFHQFGCGWLAQV